MKSLTSLLIRAACILAVSSLIGMGLNFASSRPLPWIYEPPNELQISGLNVPIIDEKRAYQFFNDGETVFVDTRNPDDYSQGRVKGAVFLPAYEKENRFPVLQPLLPKGYRLILYCYGPQCEMAEDVAGFLAQLGYKKMMIMASGYRVWKKAGYPVEKSRERE